MAILRFGPNASCDISAVLKYIVHITSTEDRLFCDYNRESKTVVANAGKGVYKVKGVTIHIEPPGKTFALDGCILKQECFGQMEADTFDEISQLFENAIMYVDNKLVNSDINENVKILTYDFGSWDVETIMKKRLFSTIHIPRKIMNDFKTDIDGFMSTRTKEQYEKIGIRHTRIYGLYGLPGTGKTSLIHATASYFNMNVGTIQIDTTTSDRMFKISLKRIPKKTIVCIEDVDVMFRDRTSSQDCGLTFSGFINALDGISHINDLVIFITTNHIGQLDNALKRRIDYFIKFEFSSQEQVHDMFVRFFPDGDFGTFWNHCKWCKVTPSILQKFFTRNLTRDVAEFAYEIKEFSTGEHSIEKICDMYT
jgi:hypothetical protein